MRRLLLTGLLMLLVVAPAAARADEGTFAGSSPAITPLPALDGLSYAGDDGSRRVIAGPAGGNSDVILDLSTGIAAPLVLPTEPVARPDWPAGACPVTIAGPHEMFVQCPWLGVDPAPAFIGSYDPPGWTELPAFEVQNAIDSRQETQDRVVALGDHWLEIGTTGHEQTMWTSYWSLDALLGGRVAEREDDSLGVHAVADVNQPDLSHRLCAPIARSTQDYEEGVTTGKLDRMLLAGRWAVSQSVTYGTRAITVQRCGSRSLTTVCSVHCGPVVAHGHWAAWTTSRGFTVRNLATGRATRVRVRGAYIQLHLIGSSVLVSQPTTATTSSPANQVDSPAPWGVPTIGGPSYFGTLRLSALGS